MTHAFVPQRDSHVVEDPAKEGLFSSASYLPQDSWKYFLALAFPGLGLNSSIFTVWF